MDAINIILPLASSALSFTFAILIMSRYVKKRGLHQLLWGFGRSCMESVASPKRSTA